MTAGTVILLYLGAALVLSLVSFGMYGFDKSAAQAGRRRIPEKTLHILSLLGGWPGALAGQQTFRHKTRKVSFQVIYWITVAINSIVVIWIIIQVNT